jgi:hypothetical protein
MQSDAAQSAMHAPSSYLPVRHSIAQAVADLVRPHSSMLEDVAARGRLRELLTSYVRALRAEGATLTDILTATNGVARRAVSGVAPARVSADIRDTIRRWALAAYDRAD